MTDSTVETTRRGDADHQAVEDEAAEAGAENA